MENLGGSLESIFNLFRGPYLAHSKEIKTLFFVASVRRMGGGRSDGRSGGGRATLGRRRCCDGSVAKLLAAALLNGLVALGSASVVGELVFRVALLKEVPYCWDKTRITGASLKNT